MTTILREIQSTVRQYAEIISQVINVDVEIVDHQFVRIAGTGFYKNQLGLNMANEGFVFRTALETGQTQIIKDPGRNKLCISCPKQLICAEKLEMCKPIKLGQEIIGIIGLICFTDEQRDRLLGNFDAYLAFLDQIAEFIASKAYEKKEKRRTGVMIDLMNQVIDKTSRGIIILNRDDQLRFANQNAIKQLELSGDFMGKQLALRATGDSVLDSDEFILKLDEREFSLAGNIFPVDLDLEDYARIFIFNEMKAVKSRIYELTKVGESFGLDNILGNTLSVISYRITLSQYQAFIATTSPISSRINR